MYVYCIFTVTIIIAHLAKVHFGFCYHVVSLVCRLSSVFTFESSPLKPLGQMTRNLVENIYGRLPIKIANFVPFLEQT